MTAIADLDLPAFRADLESARAALPGGARIRRLEGAREVLLYSYGIRGKDLALQLRAAGVAPVVYDRAEAARARAAADGFEVTARLDLDLPLIVAAGQNQIEVLGGLGREAVSLAEALHALDLRNSYGRARDFTEMAVGEAERLYQVYRRLDPGSRQAFHEVLCYRASLDVHRLAHRRPMAEMWRPEARGLRIGSFCDIGAFDGDSLAATKAVFPELERSFTIEPNPELGPAIAAVAEAHGIDNTSFAGAAWDRTARLGARLLFNGMLVIEETADGDVPAERLDALLGDEAFDYIKMDVEGSEAKVLAGGEEAVRRAKCVAMAAYHLPCDLIDLPERMERILGPHDGSAWRLAFAHYSQSFDDSIFYFHRGEPA